MFMNNWCQNIIPKNLKICLTSYLLLNIITLIVVFSLIIQYYSMDCVFSLLMLFEQYSHQLKINI